MPWRAIRGFTLVELILVLVILGILALVAAPRWAGTSGFAELGFRDRLVAGLRYGQKSAIAARRTVCASFSSPPAQAAFRISSANGVADCTVGAALPGPDSQPLLVIAADNVGFAALPADVVFDAAGRPASGASISVAGLSAAQVITIEAETGYVH